MLLAYDHPDGDGLKKNIYKQLSVQFWQYLTSAHLRKSWHLFVSLGLTTNDNAISSDWC